MQNRIVPSRGTMIAASVITAVAIGLVPAGGAFAAATPADPIVASASASSASPSDVLAGTPWETTSAVDQDGNAVELTDEAVANFVGWAYYKTDGTFTMYELTDTPKMQGDWTVSADGSERTLVAKDDAGEVLFERTVPITVLTEDEFTYRVVPDEADPATYYDIIHTPTDHPEPLAAQADDAQGDDAQDEAAASADNGDSDGDQLAETGNAGPIAALVAGIVALLGGAAVYITRMVRRGRTS
jgi:LPXTG-motif cell wall-anchored protein